MVTRPHGRAIVIHECPVKSHNSSFTFEHGGVKQNLPRVFAGIFFGYFREVSGRAVQCRHILILHNVQAKRNHFP